MIQYCVSVGVLLVSTSPLLAAVDLEQELGVIKELLQAEHTVAARARTEELLRAHPANPTLLYLLAFSQARDGEVDKSEAVRLALELVNNPGVSASLYGSAAQLALEAAHNSDNDSLIREASQQVTIRDSQRPLQDKTTRELALTLLGEQLLLQVMLAQTVTDRVMTEVGRVRC